MDYRIKYIFIALAGVLAIFMIFIIVVVFNQQKTILKLQNQNQEKSNSDYLGTADANDKPSIGTNSEHIQVPTETNSFLARATQKTIIDNTRELKGVVVTRNNDSLELDADLIDFAKLKGMKDDDIAKGEMFWPKIKKNYTVTVTDKTKNPSIEYQGLAAGMRVKIETDGLIYGDAGLTALKIYLLEGQKAPTEEQIKKVASSDYQQNEVKMIAGQIKEVNEKYLLVETFWIDFSKVEDIKKMTPATVPKIAAQYKVFSGDKTIYTDKKLGEFKAGDTIKAYSDKPTFPVKEFVALKIEGPLKVPKNTQ
jgi:hypothetical protein